MKKITVSDKYDNKYTLEFTRETIMQMERKGFDVQSVESKPLTSVRELFAGAFLKNHKHTPAETIDEIYASMSDKETLLTKLVEMYSEPIEALMNDPTDEVGNAKWEANW